MASTRVFSSVSSLHNVEVVGIFADYEAFLNNDECREIFRLAGNIYHGQLDSVHKNGHFRSGSVVIAKCLIERTWPFETVSFICDDLAKPFTIEELVRMMLTKVSEQGYKSIALQVPRTDMPGQFPVPDLVAQFASALSRAKFEFPQLDISIVCCNESIFPHVEAFFT